MFLKTNLLSILLLFVCIHSFGINLDRDSLIRELKGEKDSAQIALLHFQYGFSFFNEDLDSFVHYNEKAAAISHRLNYQKGIVQGMYYQGVIYRLKEQYDSSMIMLDSARAMVSQIENTELLSGQIYHGIATVHFYTQQYDSALYWLEKSNSYYERLNNNKNLAINYSTISTILTHQGLLSEALKFSVQALSMYASKDAGRAYTYFTMSNIYLTLEQYEEAIKQIDEGLKVAKEMGLAELFVSFYYNYSMAHVGLQEFEKADSCIQKALEISITHNSKNSMAACYAILGTIRTEQGQLEHAMYWFEQQLNLAEEIDNIYFQANALKNLCGTSQLMGAYRQAEDYGLQSVALYKQVGTVIELAGVYEGLSEIAELNGSDRKALQYYREHILLRDSLYNVESVREIGILEKKHAVSEQNKIIELEKSRSQLLAKEKEAERGKFYLAVTVGLLLLLTGGGSFFILNNRRKFEKVQRQLMQAEVEVKKKENSLLSKETDLKNKEVTHLALLITEHNRFLAKIKGGLQEGDGKTIPEIKNIANEIQQQITNNREKKEFLRDVDLINEVYFDKLKGKIPTLTPKELRLSALLRLGLSSKEISSILGIASESVDVKRYRMRKKIGLSNEQDLTEYLKGI